MDSPLQRRTYTLNYLHWKRTEKRNKVIKHIIRKQEGKKKNRNTSNDTKNTKSCYPISFVYLSMHGRLWQTIGTVCNISNISAVCRCSSSLLSLSNRISLIGKSHRIGDSIQWIFNWRKSNRFDEKEIRGLLFNVQNYF